MKKPEDLASDLVTQVERALSRVSTFSSEQDFQVALATALGDSERELPAQFDGPRHPPRRPPSVAIEALGRKSPPRRLSEKGRDPCARAARLDILWKSPAGRVPIELKFCAKWKSDVNGYQFMKDLHRLERMTSAGSHAALSDSRFAIFATRESVYWRGERPEPAPFWLTEGRTVGPRYWVQYDQQSPDTLWYSYPPFYLANEYEFRWRNLVSGWRYLMVPVRPQES